MLSNRILSLVTQRRLLLPVYHLVSDNDVAHIKHLYQIKNTRDFNLDLDFLLKYYEPLDLPGLIEIIHGSKELKKKSFFLSFDDGLREFGEVVVPILMRRGISGLCFLNNYFIDNKALFFRYKASLLIEILKEKDKDFDLTNVARILNCENLGLDALTDSILKINYLDKSKIDEIAACLGIDYTQYLREHRPYLTSEEIVELQKKGMYFGAHSLDHPEYYLMSFKDQVRQTTVSVIDLNSRFDLKHKTFAFPFTDHGLTTQFFKKIEDDIPELDITFGSAGLKRERMQNHVQRIPMEMGKLSARQIINGELLYYLLKMPFGKNIVSRDDMD